MGLYFLQGLVCFTIKSTFIASEVFAFMPFQVQNIISDFSPVSLEGLDRVSLMDRTEIKYVVHVNRIHELIIMAKDHYRILELDSSRIFSYYNMYYDTNEYLFYNQHLTGKLPRHKVRVRRYENSGVTFLEVKRKTNKDRTNKFRYLYDPAQDNMLTGDALMFVREHVQCHNLKPVLVSRFSRITFAGNNSSERITIDYDISFRGMTGNDKDLSCFCIIEIKKKDTATASFLSSLLKANRIRTSAFSKYCMGNAMVNSPARMNALKTSFLRLKKIENGFYNAG